MSGCERQQPTPRQPSDEAAQAVTAPQDAAEKAATIQALDAQWSAFSTALPLDIEAIRGRIAALRRKPRTRPPPVDLGSAAARLSDDASLWSKAQAAFASGNMREAVATAIEVEAQLRDLAAALLLRLPAATTG